MRTRRRLAATVATSLAVGLVGVAFAPSASAGGVLVTPNTVVNTENRVITFTGQTGSTGHYENGSDVIFTLLNRTDTATVTITATLPASPIDPVTGNRTVSNSNSVSIDFAQPPGQGGAGPADAGTYDVLVDGKNKDAGTVPPSPAVSGSDDACTSCFTVLSSGQVTVNNANPSVGKRGDGVAPAAQPPMTIFGNNFERGSTVEFLLNGAVDPKITFTNGAVTRTRIPGTYSIAADAVRGARGIRVRNRDGVNISQICSVCFSVDFAPIMSTTPAGAANDDVGLTTVTFSGTDMPPGTPTLTYVSGTTGSSNSADLSIPGQNVRSVSPTSTTADFDLRNAAPGSNAYLPTLVATDGSRAICTCRFTVLQRLPERTPVVYSIDSRPDLAGNQSSQPRGSVRTFAVSGQYFSKGTRFEISAPQVTVQSSRYISPTAGEVTFVAPADAALGNRDVRARLTDDTISSWCAGCHFVSQTELDPPASPQPCPTASPSPSSFPANSPSPSPTGSPAPSPSATPCVSATPSRSPSATPSATATATTTPSPAPTETATSAIPPGRYVGLSSARRAFDSRKTSQRLRRGLVNLSLADYLPGPATAAVLNVTVVDATGGGFVVVYPAAGTRPATSNVNFGLRAPQANEVITRVSPERDVSLSIDSPSSAVSAALIVDVIGYFTTDLSPPGGRVTLGSPRRVFDSATTSVPRRRGEVEVDLASVPTGTTSVILNVTVDGPDRGGYVVVYPSGAIRPETSNVNFIRGQQQANEVITDLGTARRVTLALGGGAAPGPSARLVVDLIGTIGTGVTGSSSPTPRPTSTRATASPTPTSTVSSGGTVLTALDSPQRVLDTRPGSGNIGAASGRKNGALTVTLPSSLPANATAVVLNVTTTGADRGGFVAVYPGGAPNPGTSNVNFRVGADQANEVVVRLGPNRTVTLFVGGGSGGPLVHLIADLTATLGPVGSSLSATPSASPTRSISPSPTRTTSPRPSSTASPSPSPTPKSTVTPTPTCSPNPANTCLSPLPSPTTLS